MNGKQLVILLLTASLIAVSTSKLLCTGKVFSVQLHRGINAILLVYRQTKETLCSKV